MAITSQTFTFAPSVKKVATPKGRAIEFAFDDATGGVTLAGTALGAASIGYLVAYGAKQSLADSYASAKDQAEFDAFLDKRLAKILAGTMSIREAGTPSDPFESEVIKLAKARLSAIAAKKGAKLPKVDSDEYKALLAKVRNGKSKDELEAKAREILATRAAVSELEDDDLDFDGVTGTESEAPEGDETETDSAEGDSDETPTDETPAE